MPREAEISTIELFVQIGVFARRADAEEAVYELRSLGLSDERIGMLSRQDTADTGFGLQNDPTNSRWEEGTVIGAAGGAAVGTGLGLAVAAGLIPAIGPVIAGGILTALIASAGAGATVGTVAGGLIGLGVPEDEAGYFGDQVAAGRTVVAAQTDGPAPWIGELFRRHHALERGTVTNTRG